MEEDAFKGEQEYNGFETLQRQQLNQNQINLLSVVENFNYVTYK